MMVCRILCALLFVGWTAEASRDTVLYQGYWRSPFQLLGPLIMPLPVIGLSVWQVALLALAPLWFLRGRAVQRQAWPMNASILTSLASILVTFLWGWLRDGSVPYAYMQLWKFLTALLMGALLLVAVRSSRDLKALGLTVLMAALVRGTLAIYFYWFEARGRIHPLPDYMTTHDDSLLFVGALLVMLSWALARRRTMTWLVTAAVSAHLLYAIVLNRRRLAWLELLLALVVLYILIPRSRQRRRLNRLMLVAAPVVLMYVFVGWGRGGAVFEPLRALATAGSDEDASSLARLEEMRNLMYTLSTAGNPLLGTGWGRPYEKVTSVYANLDEQWREYLYLPHNSLVGVAVFGGLVGLFGILVVIPVAAYLGTKGYLAAQRPADRAAAMASVCILPAYAVQCYGDIGFHSFTCSLLLGAAIAAAGNVYLRLGTSVQGERSGGGDAYRHGTNDQPDRRVAPGGRPVAVSQRLRRRLRSPED